MIDPHHIWNVIYNARSNKTQPPTSANSAPATQNESRDWSASHMKRHLQCAEQQASTSNLTKYCACQAECMSWLIVLTYETSFPIRRAARVTLQLHQILRLPRKLNLNDWSASHMKRHLQCAEQQASPSNLPNTAPATQNESHDWSASHMKRHLQCAEQQASTSNLTKYCACHAKWPPQHLTEICWKQVKRHFQCATDPRPFRAWSDPENAKTEPRRAAKATFRTRQEQILLNITTFPAPAIIPNFTTCCACHEKWHMNFTKCCPCHEKWHMNLTKCCACHEKWHMNSTKCCACHEKWHMNFTKCWRLPRKVTQSDTWLLLLLLLLLLGLLLLGLLFLSGYPKVRISEVCPLNFLWSSYHKQSTNRIIDMTTKGPVSSHSWVQNGTNVSNENPKAWHLWVEASQEIDASFIPTDHVPGAVQPRCCSWPRLGRQFSKFENANFQLRTVCTVHEEWKCAKKS